MCLDPDTSPGSSDMSLLEPYFSPLNTEGISITATWHTGAWIRAPARPMISSLIGTLAPWGLLSGLIHQIPSSLSTLKVADPEVGLEPSLMTAVIRVVSGGTRAPRAP